MFYNNYSNNKINQLVFKLSQRYNFLTKSESISELVKKNKIQTRAIYQSTDAHKEQNLI